MHKLHHYGNVQTLWTFFLKKGDKQGMLVLLNYAVRMPDHNAELVVFFMKTPIRELSSLVM
jgi:hypothetical protein